VGGGGLLGGGFVVWGGGGAWFGVFLLFFRCGWVGLGLCGGFWGCGCFGCVGVVSWGGGCGAMIKKVGQGYAAAVMNSGRIERSERGNSTLGEKKEVPGKDSEANGSSVSGAVLEAINVTCLTAVGFEALANEVS